MSITTYAYGINLPTLTAAIGSHDATLVNKILESGVYRWARDDLRQNRISLRDALQMLINAEYSNDSPVAVARRLYAYETLCEHLGRRLDGQEHVGYLDELGWDTLLMNQRTPIGLVASIDFPMSGYLTPEEVVREYDQYMDVEAEEDDLQIADAREEFVWWLKQCANKRLALVTFTY